MGQVPTSIPSRHRDAAQGPKPSAQARRFSPPSPPLPARRRSRAFAPSSGDGIAGAGATGEARGRPSPPGRGYLATPEPAWPQRGDLCGPLGSQARAAPSPPGTPPWCGEEQGGCCSEPNPKNTFCIDPNIKSIPRSSLGNRPFCPSVRWIAQPGGRPCLLGGTRASLLFFSPHFNCVLPTGTSSPAPFYARHNRYLSPRQPEVLMERGGPEPSPLGRPSGEHQPRRPDAPDPQPGLSAPPGAAQLGPGSPVAGQGRGLRGSLTSFSAPRGCTSLCCAS